MGKLVRKIIKISYTPDYEKHNHKNIMVERSGFIDRSTLIAKMGIQGEINKLLIDFENNMLSGRASDSDKVLPVLNIKDINRPELVKAVRSRKLFIDDSFKEYSNLQKEQARLLHHIDYKQLNTGSSASDNSQAVKE